MRVAVLGASGLIGGLLLEFLVAEGSIDEIYVIHYRELEYKHSKIKVVVTDFSRIDQLVLDASVDAFFCCLGTTKKKTPDMVNYHQIDVDYPVAFAKWFQQQGGQHYSVVSAVSADANASNYYNKFKGELEQCLESLQLPHLAIMQPSLLLGPRGEFRVGEGVGKLLSPLINILMVGGLKKYRAIAAHKVAKQMFKSFINQVDRVKRYTWNDFSNL